MFAENKYYTHKKITCWLDFTFHIMLQKQKNG